MTHQEEFGRRVGRGRVGRSADLFGDVDDEVMDVGENELSVPCLALERFLPCWHAATPASLVEAMNGDVVRRARKSRKQAVVCVDVIREAMEKDEM